MPTITIPKELTREKELLVVPKREYERFIVWQRRIKSVKTFSPAPAEKKALSRARKNLREGKYSTLEQLKHELGIGN